MTLGFSTEAAAYYRRGGDLAFAAGDSGFAAQMFAATVALAVGGDEDADLVGLATRALTLAVQFAGPYTVNLAKGALATALGGVDAGRARELLAEAIDAMDVLGYENVSELTQAAIISARLGDWPLTLRLARRAIPLLHWEAVLPYLQGVFHICALALVDLRPDAAARLQGAARSIGRTLLAKQGERPSADPAATPANAGFITALRRNATERLAAILPEDQLAQRRHEGEEMDIDHAVSYALAEIDAVLADPTFDQ